MTRRVLIIGALLLLPGLSFALVTYFQRATSDRQADDPIARLQALSYDEAAPYFDALFVWRLDGRAWYCADNNFDKLPDRPVLRWLAKQATPVYLDAAKGAGVTISSSYRGPRIVGDSPWGAFEIPEIRVLMERPFEDAKKRFVEILLERESGEEKPPGETSRAGEEPAVREAAGG